MTATLQKQPAAPPRANADDTSQVHYLGLGGYVRLVFDYLKFFIGMADRPRPQPNKKLMKSITYPVRAIVGPLVMNKTGRWAVIFKLPLVEGFENMSDEDQNDLMLKLHRLHADPLLFNRPGRIYGYTRPLDPKSLDKRWRQQLIPHASPGLTQRNRAHREHMKRRVGAHNFRQLDVYMQLQLKEPRSLIFLMSLRLQILLGRNPTDVYRQMLDRFEDQVTQLLDTIRNHGFPAARTATQREVYWLIEKTIFPGHDISLDNGLSDEVPLTDAVGLKKLTDSVMHDWRHCLKIDRDDDDSMYTSFVALGRMPDTFDYEFLFNGHNSTDPQLRRDNGQPVDFTVAFRSKPPKQTARNATRRTQRQLQSGLHLSKNQATSIELANNRDTRKVTAELLAFSKASGVHVELNMMVMISARTERQLKGKRSSFTNRMQKYELIYQADKVNQLKMLQSAAVLSGVRYTDYQLPLRTLALGKSFYLAATGSGNDGAYQGVILGRHVKPFLFSLSRALLKENDTAGLMTIIAPPGSGKTFCLLQLADTEASDGSCVLLDGGASKDDLTEVLSLGGIPVFHLDLTTMRGALNPGMIGQTYAEKHTLIKDFMRLASKNWREEWDVPVGKAIDELLNVPQDSADFARPDLRKMHTWLKAGRYEMEGVRFAHHVEGIFNHPMSDAFFSTDVTWEQLEQFMQPGQVTISHYGILTAPRQITNREDWTDTEHLAVLFRRLSKSLFDVVATRRDTRCCLIYDEMHQDASLGGASYITQMGRIIRSLNCTVMLASQEPGDFDDNFYGYVVAALVFKQDDERMAAKCLPALRIKAAPGSPEETLWVKRIARLEKGQYQAYFRWGKNPPVKVQIEDAYGIGIEFESNNDAREKRKESFLASHTRPHGPLIMRQPDDRHALVALRALDYLPSEANQAELRRRLDWIRSLPDQIVVERTEYGIVESRLVDVDPRQQEEVADEDSNGRMLTA